MQLPPAANHSQLDRAIDRRIEVVKSQWLHNQISHVALLSHDRPDLANYSQVQGSGQ